MDPRNRMIYKKSCNGWRIKTTHGTIIIISILLTEY